MTHSECPDEGVLLALAEGQEVPEGARVHVTSCAACSEAAAAFQQSLLAVSQFASRSAASALPLGIQRQAPFTDKYFVAGPLDQREQVTIYRAVHAVLNQQVSLTLANAPLRADEAERLISQAARPLLELEHPALARVLDCGFTAGVPYVVEEYVEGIPLVASHARERGDWRRAVRYVAELSEALAAVQQAGLPLPSLGQLRVLIDAHMKLRITQLSAAWLESQLSGGVSVPPVNVPQLNEWLIRLLLRDRTAGDGWDTGALQGAGVPRRVIEVCSANRAGVGGGSQLFGEYAQQLHSVGDASPKWRTATAVLLTTVAVLAWWLWSAR